MTRILIFCSLFSLSACGGGGCDPCEPDVPTPRVACGASGVCK